MASYEERYEHIQREQPTLAISHAEPLWKTIVSGIHFIVVLELEHHCLHATGYSTGIIYVLTGHPFDTLKLRVQTGATKQLFRHLYRGILPPLLTTPPSWSINFMLYQASLQIFANDTCLSIFSFFRCVCVVDLC